MMIKANDQDWNPCSDKGLGSGYYKWIYILYYAIISKKVRYRGGKKNMDICLKRDCFDMLSIFCLVTHLIRDIRHC